MDQLRVQPNVAPLEVGHGGPAAIHLGGPEPNSWAGNDSNTLLVVAALITTLTYQLGTSIPGGYWQESQYKDGTRPAIPSCATCTAPVVLTFVVSQPRTHLSIDIVIWDAVVAFLWVTVSLRSERRERAIQALCCAAREPASLQPPARSLPQPPRAHLPAAASPPPHLLADACPSASTRLPATTRELASLAASGPDACRARALAEPEGPASPPPCRCLPVSGGPDPAELELPSSPKLPPRRRPAAT
ncbi:hypothetical protein PR202_ga26342 [Eleusine coracana subsp. coracana]|uniref:PGG domain-containing protein n=1 Tax=Eleusine coracana subsp. coracana TaxID=191504 RepID=A0AAV5DE82_ELECO|nr:hypothetical protein PR202_ga26342 [Eleusine coracana subsp. coracana]